MNIPLQEFKMAVYAALGAAPDEIEPGRMHRFSLNGKRGDTAGWCLLFEDGRAGVYGDFRSGKSLVWAAHRGIQLTPPERADVARQLAQTQAQRADQQRQQRANNARRNADLWAQTVPVTYGDPLSLYLQQRGLAGPVPECLRLHPGLTYWDDGDRADWPAMVAPVVSSNGRMLALHRTYLTLDGRKAPVPTVKKLTGTAGLLAGSCIPLHAPLDGVIGVAEGIETALAAHLASGLPTVAAYCASNLAAYRWPPGVQRIVVFADADPAGAAAAQRLKGRARQVGLNVTVLTPSALGADWCDVWARRCGVWTHGSEASA